MKKQIIEILDFEEEKPKVGRPRLADKKTKRNSLIIACCSLLSVTLLFVFGYGTLFGFNSNRIKASLNSNNNTSKNVIIDEIKPIIKDISIKEGTKRKLYLTILPADSTNKEILYKSSNSSIVSVDKEGKITGIKQGKAKIYAYTTDGSGKEVSFNIKVVKNVEGTCDFSYLDKKNDKINYQVDCNNARIKNIQYKIGNGDFEQLLTTKKNDYVRFSKEQLEKNILFKVVYYPNNSKITKYKIKEIKNIKKKTNVNGTCNISFNNVKSDSLKYDITCNNATVSKIAYKIGNGSYIGIDSSSLADTIIYKQSDVTRPLYFNIEYTIDGTDIIKTKTKNTVIQNVSTENLILNSEEEIN